MSIASIPTRAARTIVVVPLVLALNACAGATVGSGVGESVMREAPYYAGRLLPVDSQAAIAVMPIGYQRGAAQSPIFEPEGDEGSALAALLDDMNAFLADSVELGPLIAAEPLTGTAPDVMFRCVADPFEECAFDEGIEPRMRLAVARPSDEWRTAFAGALADAGAAHALMITLEISDYWTYQRNLRGSKEVRLGTNNDVDLPWVTSLETPVSVLQVTGAIIDRDGRAVRIGAEGMLARRTGILISAMGGQRLITDDDVAALREMRREDLPGQPLAWKVALRNLVEGLTGLR